ncbi:MAG: tripartite tricarboxylate transporter substrate binding protein [Pseudomonadota bacterium]
MKRAGFLQVIAACALTAALGPAAAADYPERPIRIVVAFEAGGNTDLMARLLAEDMSRQFGKAVIVENRSGANGIIGTEAVVKAKPDGYTLLFVSSSIAINPSVYAKLPYDTQHDLIPTGELARGQGLLVLVPATLPVTSLKDFVRQAKSADAKWNYSSPGFGNYSHLAVALFLNKTQGKLAHVPYKSSAQAVTAVASGEVQLTMQPMSVSLPLLQAGKIKAIGFAGPKRFADTPDVPTVAEAGFPDATLEGSWLGLFAPAGTAPDVIDRLNTAVVRARSNPKVLAALQSAAWDPGKTGSKNEFGSFVRSEINRYTEIANEAGITKMAQ